MGQRSSFDYAVIQIVPRVDRDERMNAGVVLYCRTLGFLDARVALDRSRLAAFAPSVDLDEVERALSAFPVICSGGPASGPIGGLPQGERFHWLVAPRSTIVQTSPVHSGLCLDPRLSLDQLVERTVLPVPADQ